MMSHILVLVEIHVTTLQKYFEARAEKSWENNLMDKITVNRCIGCSASQQIKYWGIDAVQQGINRKRKCKNPTAP